MLKVKTPMHDALEHELDIPPIKKDHALLKKKNFNRWCNLFVPLSIPWRIQGQPISLNFTEAPFLFFSSLLCF